MKKRASLLLFLLIAGGACRERPSTGPARTKTTPVASAGSASRDPLQKARQLALMPTRENALVDQRLAQLTALVRQHPQRLATLIELGRAWLWKARETSDPGYYLNADACVELALALAPGDRLALDLRALVLLNDHRFKDAYELAATLVERDPEAPMAWGSLSDALLELGELERAERASDRMLDLKPNLPSYSRAAYFKWLHGDSAAAIELSRLAIDAGNDPKSPEPRAWVIVQTAMIFWHRGDLDGADAGFVSALAAVADYPPALVGRGRVALARGDQKGASDWLERAFRRSPLVETAWLLGQARELAGDEAGARAAFADAEREGRRSDRRTLSLLFSSRDQRAQEALELAQKERATRGDVQTEDALAWALYRNGRFAEANAASERALRFGTQDARLMFHQGAIWLALGREEAGARLIRKALALNPHFDIREAAEARRLLARKSAWNFERVARG
ncbi:MAG TPA: tetratricopeptide repeat protein [Polyangiaceae bacterium]|nr:tetratricopeptide repeat protein [Polyangiaceae bacterium]